MTDDPLDRDVSASLEVTDTGIKANAKSRFVSGVDRLLGSVTEFLSIPLEERNAIRRERLLGHTKMMRTAADVMVAKIAVDPELAQRAMEGNFSKLVRRQENKEMVVALAIENIKDKPPTDEQEQSGPPQLSPEFLDAFERHAEDASSADLRQKWASVLASEIRNPGLFTKKAMRILDEVEPTIAKDFAEMSRYRIGASVPLILHEPSFGASGSFIEYDLINSTYPNTIRHGLKGSLSDQSDCFFIVLDGLALVFSALPNLKEKIDALEDDRLLTWHSVEGQGCPALKIILPTNTGRVLMGLMEDNSLENAKTLLQEVRNRGFTAYLMEGDSAGQYHLVA